jgi:hypothetical protein
LTILKPATLPPLVAVFEVGKPTPITPPISATVEPPVFLRFF